MEYKSPKTILESTKRDIREGKTVLKYILKLIRKLSFKKTIISPVINWAVKNIELIFYCLLVSITLP